MSTPKHLVLFVSLLVGLSPSALKAQKIQFSIKNIAPENGIWIMRPWIGINDGHFQTFAIGQPASSGVQHIAEDGVTGDVANVLPPPNVCRGLANVYNSTAPCMFDLFNNYPAHGPQASLGNPTRRGATLSTVFQLDHKNPDNQYLSYLVMIVPSNDAFFGTDSDHPIRLFNGRSQRDGEHSDGESTLGTDSDKSDAFDHSDIADADGMKELKAEDKEGDVRFNDGEGPINFVVFGSEILDAGTEANDEGAAGQMDTAFLNQGVNGTGTHPDPVDSTVHVHPGFIPGGPILTGCNMFGGTRNCFSNGDFTQPGYQVAEVTISVVPGSVDPLMNLVNSLGLGAGINQSLSAELQRAKASLDAGNFSSGCRALNAFGSQVRGEDGNLIPNASKVSLLAALNDVSQVNGCN